MTRYSRRRRDERRVQRNAGGDQYIARLRVDAGQHGARPQPFAIVIVVFIYIAKYVAIAIRFAGTSARVRRKVAKRDRHAVRHEVKAFRTARGERGKERAQRLVPRVPLLVHERQRT